MLGFNQVGHTNSIHKFVLSILTCVIGILATSYLQDLLIYDIQSAKFPPSLKYGFVSIFSILIAKNIEGHIKHMNLILVHIGKTAIFYYFAQGIGSSIIYFAVNAIQINNWFMKWCIMLFINVLITASTAEILAFLYYNTIEKKLLKH